jgi:acylphosphatase
MTERLHCFVSGRVQGVGFRYFVRGRANEIGLTGWVRNLYDGRVEVLAEGERATLQRLEAALRQGPPGSDVTNVDIEMGEGSGEFRDFAVRQTD